MSNAEARMYADSFLGEVERIISCLDGMSTEQINQRPPASGANSLLVLAVHILGNLQEAVFEILDGQPATRDRDSEFIATGMSAEDVRQQWDDLQPRVRAVIEGLSEEQLDKEYQHWRWGNLTGRAVLLRAAMHAAEHAGHAELTRDWIESSR